MRSLPAWKGKGEHITPIDSVDAINVALSGNSADNFLQVRWYETILQSMRQTRPCLRI
jgi:hypothetical protein